MSRGYNNLNPGNLIKSNFKFVGEIDSSDSRFRTFLSMAWGFRAMLKVLQNYIKGGYNTLDKIINRYAPSFENPTEAYIDFVSRKTGIDPDKTIQASDRSVLVAIAYAMATMENGSAPKMSDIEAGWDLLKVYKLPEIGSPGSSDPGSAPAPGGVKKKTVLLPIAILSAITLIYFYAERKKISY